MDSFKAKLAHQKYGRMLPNQVTRAVHAPVLPSSLTTSALVPVPVTKRIKVLTSAIPASSPLDVLTPEQINYSNHLIQRHNMTSEMFTKDELEQMTVRSVAIHADGVIRYHTENNGQFTQTPLFVLGFG